MSELLTRLETGRDEGIAARENPGFTLSLAELNEIIEHIEKLERCGRQIKEITRDMR